MKSSHIWYLLLFIFFFGMNLFERFEPLCNNKQASPLFACQAVSLVSHFVSFAGSATHHTHTLTHTHQFTFTVTAAHYSYIQLNRNFPRVSVNTVVPRPRHRHYHQQHFSFLHLLQHFSIICILLTLFY